MKMQFRATLEVFGSSPEEATQELQKIVGIHSRTATRPEIGSFNPDSLDTTWPTCREVFAQMYYELERKNPNVTLDEVFEMTKREFYRHHGHVPHEFSYSTFRHTLWKGKANRTTGRKAKVR